MRMPASSARSCSSLSRISNLSEVAKRGNELVLDEIGDTARGLVDALGDSIWSIDPHRDDLQSVLARVRHFASDLLEAKSIAMDFDVPPSLAGLPRRAHARARPGSAPVRR